MTQHANNQENLNLHEKRQPTDGKSSMTKILAYVTSTLKKNGGSREKHQ
jgi:hypothetical protein